jgi:hypothetical protein
MPVVEYSTDVGESGLTGDALVNTKRYIHPYQASVLINQGLDQDATRGAISSSSLREAPSNVFGISTPGQSLSGNTAQTTASGETGQQAIIARKGGHSFVMDDGDVAGVDQLIRLRTTSGHQILMNDTEEVLYIASSTGDQWMEFSNSGMINMYGKYGINVRTEGVLNLHGDEAVVISSPGSVEVYGEIGVAITSLATVGIKSEVAASVVTGGLLTLSALGMASLKSGVSLTLSAVGQTSISGSLLNLNSPPGGKIPTPPIPTIPNRLPDVTWNGTNWTLQQGALTSACAILPAHEPWIDPSTGQRPAPATGGLGLLGSLAVGAATSAAASAASSLF